MNETETLISKAEAARRLGISPRTLHRLIVAGKIEMVCPSPGVRAIAESEIQKYIRSLIRKSRGEDETTPQPAAEPAAVPG